MPPVKPSKLSVESRRNPVKTRYKDGQSEETVVSSLLLLLFLAPLCCGRNYGMYGRPPAIGRSRRRIGGQFVLFFLSVRPLLWNCALPVPNEKKTKQERNRACRRNNSRWFRASCHRAHHIRVYRVFLSHSVASFAGSGAGFSSTFLRSDFSSVFFYSRFWFFFFLFYSASKWLMTK